MSHHTLLWNTEYNNRIANLFITNRDRKTTGDKGEIHL